MKPYGREKNLKGRGPGKTDVHARPKKHWKNWWEDIISPFTRSRMKQIINKEIETTMEEFDIDVNCADVLIPVKSNGIIVGYTVDEGKTIDFLDNEEAKKVKEKMLNKDITDISSRGIGILDENNKVKERKITSYSIIKKHE